MVSPANSFGFMDGGIDRLDSQRFGWSLQGRLQAVIADCHHGELLVGAAEIVEINDARISFCIAAPTMRVPMLLRDSINSYRAARAVLLLIRHGVFSKGTFSGEPVAAVVRKVGLYKLGTGVGQVSPDVCAHQVRRAIEDICFQRTERPATWAEAQARHQHLYADQTRDLQRRSDKSWVWI